MFQSIKNKLIFLFLLAILTPLLVMRIIAYPIAQKAIQETTISNLQFIRSKEVFRINDWLLLLKDKAARIVANPVVVAAAHSGKMDINTSSQSVSSMILEGFFTGFFIADMRGIINASPDNRLIGLNISKNKGFGRAMKGITSFSEIVSTDVFDTGDWKSWPIELNTLHAFVPIKKETGSVMGVLGCSVDLSTLREILQEVPSESDYDVYLVNQDGLMVSHRHLETQSKAMAYFKEKPLLQRIVVEPESQKITKSVASCLMGGVGYDMDGYINYAGEVVFGAWRWIPEINWGCIVETNINKVSLAMNNLKNPISKILSFLTITGLILGAAGITFAFFIGKKIANPIVELTNATRQMSAGDLPQQVTIKTRDELSELGDAFNVMAESVQEKTTKLRDAKNFLNSILLSSTEHSIIACDLGGKILTFNEGAKRMFCFAPEELIQRENIRILHTKKDIESGRISRILKTTLTKGRYKNELQLVRKNGQVFIGFSTFTTRLSSQGEPTGFVIITRDITEQKQLEQELQNYAEHLEKIVEERSQKLRVSEEKYRRLFEVSKDTVFFCDKQYQFIDINHAGVELFGYNSKNDILQLNLIHQLFFKPEEGRVMKELIGKNGYIKDYEVELKSRDGLMIPCMMTSNLRRDERNNIVGYEGIIIDLTEWKKIEQEKDTLNNINKILASRLDLREVYKSLSTELHKVVDFDRISITLLDEKRVEFVTFALSKEYHISKLEEGVPYSKYGSLAGKVVENGEVYIVHDTAQGAFSTDPILLKEGIKSRLSVPLVCKGEIIGSLNFGSNKVHNYTETHVEIINKIVPQLAIAIDNTRLFDKIKESEQKYRNLVEDIEDVIFRMDKTGRYLFLNNALKNVTGYTPKELYDDSSLAIEIIHKDDVERVKESTRKVIQGELKVSKGLEYRVHCKNGRERWLSQNTYPIKNKNGSIIGIEGVIQEITDRKKIEERIRRSERLASIGELAASIAHEIRNPLGAISNSVCMLKRDLALTDDDQSLFDMVVEETEWLNSIITNFLTFAHQAEYHFVKSDIIKIIDETLILFEQDTRFNTKIEINKIYENNIPEIYLDRNWIRRIFWNLLMNSVDAMPNGGKIFIRLRRQKRPDNNMVEIVLSDTGSGIPPESIKKVFEPFFTTKKTRGTGLGLSIVHRVIDNHDGVIDVKSIQGKGTTFTIRLPIKNKQCKTVSL
ncbi:MAG: PAS domain S-box protein [Candidatus Brocadiaceae bacterium]|nr:PAS domain S-box protein [Candidatus Brocadiaceae bacterium]